MNLPIDTPILVWDSPYCKYYGHFHSFARDGKVRVWREGRTSHTSVGVDYDEYESYAVVGNWDKISRHAEILKFHLQRDQVCTDEAYDFFNKVEEEYSLMEVVKEMTTVINFRGLTEEEDETVVNALKQLALHGFRREE